MSDLFAPEGGWRVRIIDLSGGAEDNIVEEIPSFPTLMQANEFARRYVRDSLDRCRQSGMNGRETLDAWFAFGEDAEVRGADGERAEGGWTSGPELSNFTDRPGGEEDHDWRALDPRLNDPDEDDDIDGEPSA